MTLHRSPLSLSTVSTGVAVGQVVSLPAPARSFTVQVSVVNSTKAVVRAKGSVDGKLWVSLGAVNTTATTAGATVNVTSTANAAVYQNVRVDQVSMKASTKAGGVACRASIIGY